MIILKKHNPIFIIVFVCIVFTTPTLSMVTEEKENTEHQVPPRITIWDFERLGKIIKEYGTAKYGAGDLTRSTLKHSFLIPEGSNHSQGDLLRKLFYAFPDINELVLWDSPTAAFCALADMPYSPQALRLATFKVPMESEGIRSLARLISSLKYLRLDIMKGFDTHSIKLMADTLSVSHSLTTLFLQNIKSCGPEGGQFLAESLKHNNTLTQLKLYHCNIGSQGAAAIFQALGNNSSLTMLALNDNIGGDRDTQLNMEGLKRNATLTHLDLCLSHLGAKEIILLKDALENNSSLLFLNLGYNCLDHACAPLLSDFLTHNTSLTKLDLSSNNFSEKDTEIFTQAFTMNSTLTKLRWTYNYQNRGGLRILSKNSPLKKLNLCCNGIRHPEVPALCAALRKNKSLTKLNLKGNDITQGDQREIEDAKHSQLTIKWYW